MAQKVKVKWVGGPGLEEYHGFDGEDAHGRPIPFDLVKGQEASVSPEKAAQLKADFSHLCVVDGKGPTKKGKAEPTAAPAEEDRRETIDQVAERIEEASEEDLLELASDDRKGVQKLLAGELARREALAVGAASDENGD